MSIRTPPAKWREVRDALPMTPRPDAPVAGGGGVTGGAADSYVRGSSDGHTCPRGEARRAVHQSQGQAQCSGSGDVRVLEREGRRDSVPEAGCAGHRGERQPCIRSESDGRGDRGLAVSEVVDVTRVLLGVAVAACSALAAPAAGPPAWQLVWHDEFDGPALNATKWVRETGGDGWGNGELEFYTDRVENAHIDAGYLVIEARRESLATREYTSARLKTQGLGAWKYGRIEASIQIPRGQGLWPAFWMLGDNIPSAGWPGCGEIDIMENIGKEPGRVHGTVHGPGYSGAQGVGRAYDLTRRRSPWGRAGRYFVPSPTSPEPLAPQQYAAMGWAAPSPRL